MEMFETYNNLKGSVTSIDDLINRVLINVEYDKESIRFYLTKDNYVELYHEQDCCEQVYIEDIVGDVNDLIGSPILVAEEVSVDGEPMSEYDESYTWTYYKFRTIKGSVDIRFYGTSNGYYSERVDVRVVNQK